MLLGELFMAVAGPAKGAVHPDQPRPGLGTLPTPIGSSPGPLQMPATQLQQPAAAVTPQPTYFQAHAGWLTHGLAGLAFLICIGLVVLLAVQTTKQEGLSGSIGGAVQSPYGGPGAEEQLKRITGFVATLFVVLFVILSLTGI